MWSVAFLPDNRTLLTGGTDRMIRRWDAVTGEHIGAVAMGAPEDPLAAYAGDPGAEVFRACVACHTLSPDEGNRAGPTLAGIFGRRIATLPGYNFSDALKKLDIVWTPETVAKLFEVGPADLHARHQDAGADASARRRTARRWWIFWRRRRSEVAVSVFALALALALAQIILGGARLRARRRAERIEVLLGHRDRRGSPRTS